jgi:phosphoribosylamine--glycine ligase
VRLANKQIKSPGQTVTEAQQRAYQAVDRIRWPQASCSRDIGWQAVQREKAGG